MLERRKKFDPKRNCFSYATTGAIHLLWHLYRKNKWRFSSLSEFDPDDLSL